MGAMRSDQGWAFPGGMGGPSMPGRTPVQHYFLAGIKSLCGDYWSVCDRTEAPSANYPTCKKCAWLVYRVTDGTPSEPHSDG